MGGDQDDPEVYFADAQTSDIEQRRWMTCLSGATVASASPQDTKNLLMTHGCEIFAEHVTIPLWLLGRVIRAVLTSQQPLMD